VLLCAKKKTNSGFTAALGKWNWPWGKVDPWESFVEAARRELQEEVWVEVALDRFTEVWVIHFSRATKKERDQTCYIYVVKDYDGEIVETDEVKPQRFNIADIPYDKMRQDDIYRMPRMLAGEYVEYTFYFTDEGAIISHDIIK